MSTPPAFGPEQRPSQRLAAFRELLGLLLLVVGVVGVGMAAFATDAWLGIAYVSGALVIVGVSLSTNRSEV